MRINNLSSRLILNEWLVNNGHQPIGADRTYTEFATEFRRLFAKTVHPARFVSRPDATDYMRTIARQIAAKSA